MAVAPQDSDGDMQENKYEQRSWRITGAGEGNDFI